DDTEAHKSRLMLGYAALRGVIVYLSADPEVRVGGFTRPLGLIENALHDAARGAKPPLLDHAPEGRGSKPSSTMQNSVQGGVAAAVEILKRGGWGTKRATAEIANQARRVGLSCADASWIKQQQIENWWAEVHKGRASAGARDVFDEFLAS